MIINGPIPTHPALRAARVMPQDPVLLGQERTMVAKVPIVEERWELIVNVGKNKMNGQSFFYKYYDCFIL